MHLYIANKLYSSWSMRPWLVMTGFGIAFQETVIPMYQPDTKARILAVSPGGTMPSLVDADVTVWESLAIIEYLNGKYFDKGIWPIDPKARAHARAISNEMHAGFRALRAACPMNLGKRFAPRDFGPEVAGEVARICAIWKDARSRFGKAGPFLYGAFCAADAMFAPVVTRLDTYQIPVDEESRAYMDLILGHPAFIKWRHEALQEPWQIPHYEQGHTPVAVYHHPQPA